VRLTKYKNKNQSFIGSVAIGVELGREDHISISATAIGRG
jgi:hypothetical protein